MKNIEAIREALKTKVASAQATIEKFKVNLAESPVDALHWVNSPVEAAAILKVLPYVMGAIDAGRTAEQILSYTQDQIRNLSERGAPHSSGFLDCQLQTEELHAWSFILALLEGRR
jgi:hypothetical protein